MSNNLIIEIPLENIPTNSNNESTRILINQIQSSSTSHSHKLTFHITTNDYIIILFSIGLFIFYILTLNPQYLTESLLLLALLAANIYYISKEYSLKTCELHSRLHSLQESLNAPINYASSHSSHLSRVIRNNTLIYVPFNLIITGDLVQLALADISPAKLKLLNSDLILERGVIFKPEFLLKAQNPISQSHKPHYDFICLESPITSIIHSILHNSRPEPVIHSAIKIFNSIFSNYVFWIVLFTSAIINFTRYFIKYSDHIQAFYMLLNLQIYALLPLLPLVYPLYFFISRSFGNAQILALFDALQSSETAFQDNDDVDEFDIAPPPTKRLVVDKILVWKRFLEQITTIDVSFLARTTGLVESLASTTVICSIDREGTIALPSPSLEQLFFIGEEEEPITLDIIQDHSTPYGVKFEDKDWETHLHSLKPLSLLQLLNTDCIQKYGKRRNDNHKRDKNPLEHGAIQSCRHTCQCQISREVGFREDILKKFDLVSTIQAYAPCHPSTLDKSNDYHFEIPSIFGKLFKEVNSETFQLFSEGTFELLAECCDDYWTGEKLLPITESVEKKLLDFYQNAKLQDTQVVAFAYRPILPQIYQKVAKSSNNGPFYIEFPIFENSGPFIDKEQRLSEIRKKLSVSELDKTYSNLTDPASFFPEAIKGQTLLGLASFCYQPKPNVVDFIEDLGVAGVRFVYFSNAPQKESKAYAERLGLENDWNSCIILSSNENSHGYIDDHDMKARLPRGVENIRAHIEQVDDVPLHVSLFSECTPASTKEMIKIFQEYGEVVCCIGSSLNDFNVDCFSMADISLAVDPINSLKTKFPGSMSSFAVSAAINTIPCALSLHLDTSLYSITQLIREARTLAMNGKQAFLFYVTCQLAMCGTILLSYFLLLPPIFQGYQIMWVMWILLPWISMTYFFSPYDSQIMTYMPVKNNGHLRDKWRLALNLAIRVILPILFCVGVFILVLADDLNLWGSFTTIFGDIGHTSWNKWSNQYQSSLIFAQNFTLFIYLYYMVIISSCYISRTEFLFQKMPFLNVIWALTSAVVLILQIVFSAVSILESRGKLSNIKWWIYVIAFCGGIPILIVQEYVKWMEKKEWAKFQKRSKLEFNTKLGMHSPL